MGTPAHRLLEVERAVPYEDVRARWRNARQSWADAVELHRLRISKLAELALALLDAFTSNTVARLWPAKSEFTYLRTLCQEVESGRISKSQEAVEAFVSVVSALEMRAVQSSARSGRDMADLLNFGDEGPALLVGDACEAFDLHRELWCDAEIVEAHSEHPGLVYQYKVHYKGWKRSWDEWLARDSGRLRDRRVRAHVRNARIVNLVRPPEAAHPPEPKRKKAARGPRGGELSSRRVPHGDCGDGSGDSNSVEQGGDVASRGAHRGPTRAAAPAAAPTTAAAAAPTAAPTTAAAAAPTASSWYSAPPARAVRSATRANTLSERDRARAATLASSATTWDGGHESEEVEVCTEVEAATTEDEGACEEEEACEEEGACEEVVAAKPRRGEQLRERWEDRHAGADGPAGGNAIHSGGGTAAQPASWPAPPLASHQATLPSHPPPQQWMRLVPMQMAPYMVPISCAPHEYPPPAGQHFDVHMWHPFMPSGAPIGQRQAFVQPPQPTVQPFEVRRDQCCAAQQAMAPLPPPPSLLPPPFAANAMAAHSLPVVTQPPVQLHSLSLLDRGNPFAPLLQEDTLERVLHTRCPWRCLGLPIGGKGVAPERLHKRYQAVAALLHPGQFTHKLAASRAAFARTLLWRAYETLCANLSTSPASAYCNCSTSNAAPPGPMQLQADGS